MKNLENRTALFAKNQKNADNPIMPSEPTPTLAVDLGTTVFKACLYKKDRRVSKIARIGCPLSIKDQRVEIQAAPLLHRVKSLLSQLGPELDKIDTVVISSQGPSLCLSDERGELLTPVITHLDQRASAEARALVDALGREKWLSLSGNLPFSGGIAAATLVWFRKNDLKLMRRVRAIGSLTSFFTRALTEEKTIDIGHAAYLGLMDRKLKRWAKELCSVTGVSSELLPEIRTPYSEAGRAHGKIARFLGIPSGVRVLVGTIDTSAAALGARLAAGDLLHLSGTGTVFATVVKDPPPSPNYLSRPLGVGGLSLVIRVVPGTSATLDWLEKTFGKLPRNLSVPESSDVKLRFEGSLFGDRHALSPLPGSFVALSSEISARDFQHAVLNSFAERARDSIRLLSQTASLTGRVVTSGGNRRMARWMEKAFSALLTKPHWERAEELGLLGLAVLSQGDSHGNTAGQERSGDRARTNGRRRRRAAEIQV